MSMMSPINDAENQEGRDRGRPAPVGDLDRALVILAKSCRLPRSTEGDAVHSSILQPYAKSHRLAPQRRLVLGGVEVPHDRGLAGHSDADVVLHAIADALLGAVALGDIGQHFPDTDPAFQDADSAELLTEVGRLVGEAGYRPVNVDVTIMAQRPRLATHIPQMRRRIAGILQLDERAVSVKATTTEGLGLLGREEGIAAEAVALLATIESR